MAFLLYLTMRLWGFIMVISGFASGCREEQKLNVSTEKELQNQIKLLGKECGILVDQMYARMQSNSSAKPYFGIGRRMNDLFFNAIDTTFTAPQETDTLLLANRLKELKNTYNTTIDSFKQSSKYAQFLKSDEPWVSIRDVSIMELSDAELSYYLTIQKILYQHLGTLRVFRNCYPDYYCGFTPLYRIGRTAFIDQKESETRVILSFCSGSAHGQTYEPQGKAKLMNDRNKEIKVLSQKIQSDTIFLSIKKLPVGKYKAIIQYIEYRTLEEKQKTEIEFPFTIK